MDNGSIGENLKKYRESLGLSQEVFAEELGISRVALGKMERGKTRLINEKLERVQHTFGKKLEELLTGSVVLPPDYLSENSGKLAEIKELTGYYENLLDAERSRRAGLEQIIQGLEKELDILRSKLSKKD